MKPFNVNANFKVFPTDLRGFDQDTKRYFCTLYILTKANKELYVQCGISGMEDLEMNDYSVEFISARDMKAYTMPYFAELFEEVENAAWEMFNEMLEDEKNVAG